MSYESARDLPSFLEMERQLAAMRLFAWPMRTRLKSIQRKMHELGDLVDAFYDLLSEKNWIFHDRLSVPMVQTLLAEAPQDAERAETMLIDHYHDSERLQFMILPLRKLPAMHRRLALVEKAHEDYFAGRYYSCVHLLLSVMDGFVNEFETVRRGLHTRTPEELHAWDSVVGHHRGLAHAHRTFTKGRSTTQEEPVYELYRNGIVHGSILNYDNITVATKAWNRLFAVADWAHAREKEQQQAPAEPLTWSGLGRQLKSLAGSLLEQARIDQANQQWTPREHLPGSAEFTSHPARQRTERLLAYWMRTNYGSMSDLITHSLHTKHGNAARSEIRRAYEDYPLASYDILAIGHDMPAACTVTVRLEYSGGKTATAALRWIREDDTAHPKPEPWPGEWRLCNWEPWYIFARVES
ncbi:hypothetical protein ACIPSJ_27090 [Streptomyces sp. NPDC090088]|uniref:hypothetical protein n=1 Tax=Streptomyces sp. NPDC090088 TaxID=3365944 RepID=UPI0037F9C22D